jgi:hypothetical protein
MKSIRFPPISILESSKVVAVQLAFDVLLLPFGRCHTMIQTLQCLVSYHTTNIESLNLCTSWYCQDELSMLNHELLEV